MVFGAVAVPTCRRPAAPRPRQPPGRETPRSGLLRQLEGAVGNDGEPRRQRGRRHRAIGHGPRAVGVDDPDRAIDELEDAGNDRAGDVKGDVAEQDQAQETRDPHQITMVRQTSPSPSLLASALLLITPGMRTDLMGIAAFEAAAMSQYVRKREARRATRVGAAGRRRPASRCAARRGCRFSSCWRHQSAEIPGAWCDRSARRRCRWRPWAVQRRADGGAGRSRCGPARAPVGPRPPRAGPAEVQPFGRACRRGPGAGFPWRLIPVYPRSAVVGSMTSATAEIRSAGKPPLRACSRIISSLGAT